MKNKNTAGLIGTLLILVGLLAFAVATEAADCPGECIPAGSCSELNNYVDTSVNCGAGGVCCIARSDAGEECDGKTVNSCLPGLTCKQWDHGYKCTAYSASVPDGGTCWADGECQSYYCDIAEDSEFGSGVCKSASGPSPSPIKPAPPGLTTVPSEKCDPRYFEEVSGVCMPTKASTGFSDATVAQVIKNFMLGMLGIFGFIVIISFLISGIQYLTSAGEERQLETAKRNMKWSLVGVLVALSGMVIILAIDAALRANTSIF